jgi:hypothetical protein
MEIIHKYPYRSWSRGRCNEIRLMELFGTKLGSHICLRWKTLGMINVIGRGDPFVARISVTEGIGVILKLSLGKRYSL